MSRCQLLRLLSATGLRVQVRCEINASALHRRNQFFYYDPPVRAKEKWESVNILSRVLGSVTCNDGFWIARLDLLALLLQLHLITITYNSSQSVTASGSFRFLPGLRASSLPLWLSN
jgi:hypothetical protein